MSIDQEPCPFAVQTPNDDFIFCRSNRVMIEGGTRIVLPRQCDRCKTRNDKHKKEWLFPIPDFSDANYLEKAINFGKALAEHVSKGKKLSSVPIQAIRWEVCSKCPILNTKDKKDKYCGSKLCGCKATLVSGGMSQKVSWASSECPFSYWPRSDDQENPKEYIEKCLNPVNKEPFKV